MFIFDSVNGSLERDIHDDDSDFGSPDFLFLPEECDEEFEMYGYFPKLPAFLRTNEGWVTKATVGLLNRKNALRTDWRTLKIVFSSDLFGRAISKLKSLPKGDIFVSGSIQQGEWGEHLVASSFEVAEPGGAFIPI